MEANLDQRRVEVNQQAKPLVGQSQIGQKLLFVNRRERLNGLDFHDYRNRLLAHNTQSTLRKFMSHQGMVGRFQQPGSEGSVDPKGSIDDFPAIEFSLMSDANSLS